MKWVGTTGVVLLALTLGALPALGAAPYYSTSVPDIVEYWAPAIYQDTDSTDYDADYITAANFDGDWRSNNNWENQPRYPNRAYLYYSLIETSTHWFISYTIFHPRDWCDWFGCTLFGDAHENDGEGALLVIRKDGTATGKLQVMETEAHGNFYQYTNDPAITTGSDNIDGKIYFDSGKPVVFAEAKGHGDYSRDPAQGFPGGDGVIYRYQGQAKVPTGGNDRNSGYALKSINELWARRCNIGNGQTFDQGFQYRGYRYSLPITIGGSFDGDNYGTDKANPLWGLDDSNDGNAYKGDWFFDPAWTIDVHLNGLGTWSLTYTNNPYLKTTTC